MDHICYGILTSAKLGKMINLIGITTKRIEKTEGEKKGGWLSVIPFFDRGGGKEE